MSPDTSEAVAAWIEARMDELKPEQLTITFFGGEPLVNLPALYDLAERAHAMAARSVASRWRLESSPTDCCSPKSSSTGSCPTGSAT